MLFILYNMEHHCIETHVSMATFFSIFDILLMYLMFFHHTVYYTSLRVRLYCFANLLVFHLHTFLQVLRFTDNKWYIDQSPYLFCITNLWTLMQCNCTSNFSARRIGGWVSFLQIVFPLFTSRSLSNPTSMMDTFTIIFYIMQNMSCSKNDEKIREWEENIFSHLFPALVALYDVRWWYTTYTISLQGCVIYFTLQTFFSSQMKKAKVY